MKELTVKKRDASQNVRDYSYQFFKQNIIELNLFPGETISEAEAANLLDISRTPIHDTFSRLVDENLLTILPQKPTTVSSLDLSRIEQAVFLQRALMCAIIEKLLKHPLDDNWLFALESNLNQQYFCLGRKKLDHLFLLNNDFHHILYQASDLEYVWNTLDIASNDIWRICFLSDNKEYLWTKIAEEHWELARELRNRNKKALKNILNNYMEYLLSEAILLQKKYPRYFSTDLDDE